MNDITKIVLEVANSTSAGNPDGLRIVESLLFAEKVSLREQLRKRILTTSDRDWQLKWAWHGDPGIQTATRAVILLHHDILLLTTCCERFLDGTHPSLPYEFTYNTTEQEFSLDLADTPGIGVSHYGRGDKAIDRFLLALERAYRRIYPGTNVPWFRA